MALTPTDVLTADQITALNALKSTLPQLKTGGWGADGDLDFGAMFDQALKVNGLAGGAATIAIGQTSAPTVAVGAAFNGKRVLCSLGQTAEDATALRFWGMVAAGVLTIRTNAAATAATVVNYLIDIR